MLVLTLTLILVVSLVSFPVKAFSVISTDVNNSRVYSNQGQYAQCGIFNIFATNTKLFFYSSSGTLIKTWNTTVVGSTYNGNIEQSYLSCTKIYAINSSYVLVFTGSTYTTDSNHARIYYYSVLLNVDTLVTTIITNSFYALEFSSYPSVLIPSSSGIESVLIKQENNYYALIGSYWHDNNVGEYGGTCIFKILPTYSLVNSTSGTGLTKLYLRGSTVWENGSSLNTIYYTTRDVWLGNRFSVYKLVCNIGSLNYIADSGLDDTYGTFTYFVGSTPETIGGSNYYTMFFIYTNTLENYVLSYEVVRINDTYLNSWKTYYTAPDTPELYVRCLAVQSTSASYNSYNFIEGIYNIVFIGYGYEITYEQITVSGIDTSDFILNKGSGWLGTGAYINTTIQSSVNGGLIPFNSNLVFEYNLGTLMACCDSNISLHYSATFQYVISPLPISETLNQYSSSRPSPFDLIQLSQGITYTYNGYLYNANTTLSGNGAFTVSSTGLSLDSTPTVYTPVVSGAITNGQFVFQFSPRVNPNPTIYENVIVSWNTTTTSGYSIILIYWIASTPQTPTPTGYQFGFSGDMGTFLVLFVIIIVPTLFLTSKLGTNGFLIGLSLMGSISIVSGLMPIWFIFIIGICLVLLLFKNDVGGISTRVLHK